MRNRVLYAVAVVAMVWMTGSAFARNSKFVMRNNQSVCMSPGADGSVILWECVNNENQIWTWNGYGQIVNRSMQKCLTVVGGEKPLRLEACVNSTAQKWALTDSSGKFNNEQGWCIDAERGSTSNGTRLLAYGCHGNSNQQFAEATDLEGLIQKSGMSKAQASYLRGLSTFQLQAHGGVHYSKVYRVLRAGGGLIGTDGATLVVRGNDIVAAGAGNIVAAGAGNIVAAGAGNIVAAGAGNFVYRP